MTKIACFATHVKSIYIGFGETSLDSRTWFNVVKMFPQSKRIDTEFEYIYLFSELLDVAELII